MTPEEYLAYEQESEMRHDCRDGVVYALAGESERRSRLREIESLSDSLFVSQRRPYVEHFVRQAGFSRGFSAMSDLSASLRLTSIGCDLPLAEICDEIESPVLQIGRAHV